MLPTHPMRLLWLAAYTDLLQEWERGILSLPKSDRKKSIDLSLERVAPLNVPALCLDEGEPFLFSQNLGFFLVFSFRSRREIPGDCSPTLPGSSGSMKRRLNSRICHPDGWPLN